MIDSLARDDRTFESRLLFVKDVFTNLYPQCDIMASCVAHKLDWSYLEYAEELKKSVLYLTKEDPLDILKKID